MFTTKHFSALALIASIAVGGLAIANTKPADPALQSNMKAYVITTDKAGKDLATPATEVTPGQVVEYRLQLGSNPEFTASVLVAYARAVHRMAAMGLHGAKTVFDVAPGWISPKSAAQLRQEAL